MEFIAELKSLFIQGGIFMWAILGLHVFSIALMIERGIELFMKRKPNQESVADSFEEVIRRGEIEAVYKKAKEGEVENPVSRAIAAGAKAAMNLGGRNEIQGKMDEVLYKETGRFEKRAGFQAVIGNVATLTGLLGTITGMIKSFAAVAYANPAEKATLLSTGIAEAMNTTAYGLIVAIPALLFHAAILNRVGGLIEDMNQGAMKAFHWLCYSYSPVAQARRASQEIKEYQARNQQNAQ